MKRRRPRELQVPRSREILAKFLQIKAGAKRIRSARVAALQTRSVPSVVRIPRNPRVIGKSEAHDLCRCDRRESASDIPNRWLVVDDPRRRDTQDLSGLSQMWCEVRCGGAPKVRAGRALTREPACATQTQWSGPSQRPRLQLQRPKGSTNIGVHSWLRC